MRRADVVVGVGIKIHKESHETAHNSNIEWSTRSDWEPVEEQINHTDSVGLTNNLFKCETADLLV